MDSLITAAAQALASGDPLGALNRVALRDDADALALRGIAMAQLGELSRARALVRAAARAFGPREPLARARCAVAEAEIAFASRDLAFPAATLRAAAAALDAGGDAVNAAHARMLDIRRLLLIGRLDEAARGLADLDPAALPPALRAIHRLAAAGIAMRRLHADAAAAALAEAGEAARHAGIAALVAEVSAADALLAAPAALLRDRVGERPVTLREVEMLQSSSALVVDALRYAVRVPHMAVPLARRPVLFALVQALAEAWPADVPRGLLLARTFRVRHADESHRARLRVEIGRLRALLRGIADIAATTRGYALVPQGDGGVLVLARPVDEPFAAVLALLSDGEAWSSSALALALGASQRSVQRALERLAETGKVAAFGRGRARRWVTPPMPGFATTLLLPPFLPAA
ncbi:MAG: helix-turn-helix domain-containing protein [Proteobacteria bacterium]|nr:helix-turn-helix domain-containing protein [Pseudomonadota bacterium]